MREIRLPIRQLAEFLCRSGSLDSRGGGFDRALKGARLHRRLQKQGGEGYAAEVYLKERFELDGLALILEGRADGIFTDEEGLVTIDEIKTVSCPIEEMGEDSQPMHWAQGQLYAALWLRQEGLDRAAVRLTYCQADTGEIVRFTRRFERAGLEEFLFEMLNRYLPWARRSLEWAGERNADLKALTFPFAGYRPGQYALAGAVYRTCRDEGRLLCQAPTGIGKTMSCLFPALKALGEEKGDRIFYLTARTTQALAALGAVELLRQKHPGLRLRVIALTAKDKICFLEERECTPEACPYARGYYDRLRAGMWEALDTYQLDRPSLEQLARRHRLCPFELGLDLSLWCDLIVGDYNYLFDPVVSLKRFFEGESQALFLVDEAHNLPDRAREMYSAQLSLADLKEAKKALGRKKSRAKTALTKLGARLEELTEPCKADPEGVAFADTPDTDLLNLAARALPLLQDWLDDPAHRALAEGRALGEGPSLAEGQAPGEAPEEGAPAGRQNGPAEGRSKVLEFTFGLRDFLRTAEGFDEHYTVQLEGRGRQGAVRLLCLDPSAFLDKCLGLGRAAVLFSATLTPLPYYRDLVGSPEAKLLALPSPFDPAHLAVCLAGDVQTTYKRREEFIDRCADYLAAMVGARVGNYLAFFPSYAYLEKVRRSFEERHPGIPILAQGPGLTEAEKEAFLARFTPAPGQSLLGFAVMGGIFGEGIDLAGERLIGAAVVGVGLPQVNPVRQKLREYFEGSGGDGFAYAYQYPGMNRVLQAAGRVIRTENDRGVVLLLDERFGRPAYRRLLPPAWAGPPLQSPGELTCRLEEFWKTQGEPEG